jgi:hypothetical protein
LVSLVLVDVSSMKISRARALLKKRRRRPIHSSRARAICGRLRSLARRLFFMAQPEPVEEACDIGAMHDEAPSGKLHAQFVQCQFAIVRQAFAHPVTIAVQLAATLMTLPSWRNRSALPLQDHQVVDEAWRYPEMPGSRPMTMTLLDKRNDTAT